MPFSVVRQDITVMHVDAIVNAANTDLLMGGGVCGAIFEAAGQSRMQEACDRLAPIRTGEVRDSYRGPDLARRRSQRGGCAPFLLSQLSGHRVRAWLRKRGIPPDFDGHLRLSESRGP